MNIPRVRFSSPVIHPEAEEITGALKRTLRLLRALLLLLSTPALAEPPKVEFFRVPEKGIQPEAAIDSAGVIHLVYYKGEAAAGDLFYARMEAGSQKFSEPIKVNSAPGSAVAMGTIRCEQMALGRNRRVHVAWNPSAKSGLKGMQYARLSDSGNAFEDQKSVTTEHFGLDGGGSVAADLDGNVYVVWHAPEKDKGGEASRRVWIARSKDDGQHFDPETVASNPNTGACACCGLRAMADSHGNLYILFRIVREDEALQPVHRDMDMLVTPDHGQNFSTQLLSKMTLNACIMSSQAMSENGDHAVAAWEKSPGQLAWGTIGTHVLSMGHILDVPLTNGAKRKHPAIAQDGDGFVLIAWAEGVEWGKAADVAWEVVQGSGRPYVYAKGREKGLPAWSRPAAVARKDGTFVIIY